MYPESARRRRIVQALAGAGLAATVPALAVMRARAPTPRQTEGPFYPQTAPSETDADLLAVGRNTASVTPAALSGRILDREGRALAGARVEIWQCDAHGRYHHVDDGGGRRERDPHFQGYGQTVSDADGGYRFRTIRPVPYGGRTPHIHYRVTARDGRSLTTQLYVRGDPGNARDFLFRALSPEQAERLQADFTSAGTAGGPLEARFDLVLAG